jgi:hypothetical protein
VFEKLPYFEIKPPDKQPKESDANVLIFFHGNT